LQVQEEIDLPEEETDSEDEPELEDDLLQELENLIEIHSEELVEAEPDEDIPDDLLSDLGLLLHEFGRQPLLSREDEFRLFILIQAGQQMKQLLAVHGNSSDLDVNRDLVTDIYGKAASAHEQLLLMCEANGTQPPDSGDIFSEIFLQRIHKAEYHSAALVEWFDALPVGGAMREKAGMLALSLPILVMLLPVQVLAWLSGYLAKGGDSLPSVDDLKSWLVKTRELTLDADSLLEASDSARERMVLSNLRLVASIARRYVDQGEDFADLIQVGTIGLMRAIEKFDPALGYKFSTYATFWVRQSITRHIADCSRLIRLPVHVQEKAVPLLRIRDRLVQTLGRAPTNKEVAQACNPPLSEKVVARILQAAREPLSLDMAAGEDHDSLLGDFIVDTEAPDMEEQVAREYLREAISHLLEGLDERHRYILELRFGLSDGQERTLEEIGQEIGVTRERVRQLEAGALRKLRHPIRSRGLRDLLG